MKFERVDDKTVRCFLSNEELEEYQITYKDFIFRSDKAREVVEDIIEQAVEEVGYQPPKFALDLQIMLVPEQGMVLTFSEKSPEDLANALDDLSKLGLQGKALDPEGKGLFSGKELFECLKEVKNILEKKGKNGPESAPKTPGNQPNEYAVFAFENLRDICQFAKVLPTNLRVKSELYELDHTYFLFLEKGSASYERYSRTCIRALEYGVLYTAERISGEHLKEQGTCLISERAVQKLCL